MLLVAAHPNIVFFFAVSGKFPTFKHSKETFQKNQQEEEEEEGTTTNNKNKINNNAYILI